MAETCDRYEEAGALGDALRYGVRQRLSDSALLGDALRVGSIARFVESGTLGDSLSTDSTSRFVEGASIGDAFTGASASTHRLADSLTIGDSFRSRVGDRFAEAGALGDSIRSTVRDRLRESATIGESWSTHSVNLVRFVESGALGDSLRGHQVGRFAESAAIGDVYRGTSVATVRMHEAGALGDGLSIRSRVVQRLIDAAVLGDAFAGVSVGTVRVIELAQISDKLRQAYVGIAWTAASETMGMSTYEGVPFVSAASIGGELVGILDTGGAYALAADDDAGTPIAWRIRTGLLDFGKDQMKRPELIYVGYTAQAPILMALAGTQSGEEVEYEYELPDRVADVPGAARFKPGRGLLSRYYRLTLSSDDTQFALHSLRAVFLDSTRRV